MVEMGYNAPVDNMFVKNEKLKKTRGKTRERRDGACRSGPCSSVSTACEASARRRGALLAAGARASALE